MKLKKWKNMDWVQKFGVNISGIGIFISISIIGIGNVTGLFLLVLHTVMLFAWTLDNGK